MSRIAINGKPPAQVAPGGGVDGKLEAGSAAEPPVGEIYEGRSEPTPASTWYAASGAPITDRLLEWPRMSSRSPTWC
jgi:hypothetical protein